MKIKKLFKNYFSKNHSETMPLLIIRKEVNTKNDDIKEFDSIEDAISDIEKDLNVSPEKINKLRRSIINLKNKIIVRIKDGEVT